MLGHLRVDWEDQVLSYYEKTREKYVNTPSYQAIREDVHTRAMNRWKNYPGPTAEALPTLKRFINAFGYTLDGSKI